MEPNIRAADAAHSGITRAPFLPHPHATHFPLSPLRAPWPSSEGRGICLFPLLPLVRPGAGSLKKKNLSKSRRGSVPMSTAHSLTPNRMWPFRGSSSRCIARSDTATCSKLCETSGTTWNFWSYREVGRIRRPRGLGTMEGHRQSSSRVTLFSFATQATERVPGASIEKPRGWVLNLAAF